MKRFFLASFLIIASNANAQRLPGFISIPSGQQIVLKVDTQDVPLGPITVPFTKGWSFFSKGQVFVGRSPDETLRFEATFATQGKAVTDRQEQAKFAAENRQRLPGFQSEYIAESGRLTSPCVESAQPDDRFRYVCIATRRHDGKDEYWIAYAYVGKWAILFLNFYGAGDSAAGFERTEGILKNARWEDIIIFQAT